MKTRSRALNGVAAAVMLATFAWAGTTFAQDKPVDPAALPKKSVNAESCLNIKWNPDLLARYPWATQACQEVITVDGAKYARFEGHVVRHNRDGSFKTQFVNREGKHVKDWGYMDLLPGEEQHVMIGSEPSHFSELRRDQTLSFYVPESRFGFAERPGAQIATVVAPPPAEQVAMAEPAPQAAPPAAPQMPKTAGPLPLIALGGLASLFGALGLTLRRKTR